MRRKELYFVTFLTASALACTSIVGCGGKNITPTETIAESIASDNQETKGVSENTEDITSLEAARAYYDVANYEKAVEAYKEALKSEKLSKEDLKAAYAYLITYYLALGDAESAEQFMKDADDAGISLVDVVTAAMVYAEEMAAAEAEVAGKAFNEQDVIQGLAYLSISANSDEGNKVAVLLAQKIIETYPDDENAQVIAYIAFMQCGDTESAELALLSAESLGLTEEEVKAATVEFDETTGKTTIKIKTDDSAKAVSYDENGVKREENSTNYYASGQVASEVHISYTTEGKTASFDAKDDQISRSDTFDEEGNRTASRFYFSYSGSFVSNFSESSNVIYSGESFKDFNNIGSNYKEFYNISYWSKNIVNEGYAEVTYNKQTPAAITFYDENNQKYLKYELNNDGTESAKYTFDAQQNEVKATDDENELYKWEFDIETGDLNYIEIPIVISMYDEDMEKSINPYKSIDCILRKEYSYDRENGAKEFSGSIVKESIFTQDNKSDELYVAESKYIGGKITSSTEYGYRYAPDEYTSGEKLYLYYKATNEYSSDIVTSKISTYSAVTAQYTYSTGEYTASQKLDGTNYQLTGNKYNISSQIIGNYKESSKDGKTIECQIVLWDGDYVYVNNKEEYREYCYDLIKSAYQSECVSEKGTWFYFKDGTKNMYTDTEEFNVEYEAGRISKINWTMEDADGNTTGTAERTYYYDENNDVLYTAEIQFDASGKKTYEFIKYYDENGLKTKLFENDYNESEKITKKYEYKYNEEGDDTEQILRMYEESELVELRYLIKTDTPIMTIIYKNDGVTYKQIWEYVDNVWELRSSEKIDLDDIEQAFSEEYTAESTEFEISEAENNDVETSFDSGNSVEEDQSVNDEETALSEDVDENGTVSEEFAVEEYVSEETAAEEATSEENVSEENTAEEAAPEENATDESGAEESAQDEDAPVETVAEESVAEETTESAE